jgi:hypothetical protein
MAPYRYKISLRINHPSIDPAEITAELGEEPWHWQKAGTHRRTPKGRLLTGICPTTFWVGFQSKGQSKDRDLPSGIEALLSRLRPHRRFLHRLRDEGGEVEFFVGWFAGEQGGDILPYELTGQLADLKVDLSLDLYLGEDDAEPG